MRRSFLAVAVAKIGAAGRPGQSAGAFAGRRGYACRSTAATCIRVLSLKPIDS